MIGRGELGGFIARHLSTGVEFRLGYNHVVGGIDRVTLWQTRETLSYLKRKWKAHIRLETYKSQDRVAMDAPRRQPVKL